jgi:geranylgeranyl pyrophosphate synthase
MTSPAFALEHEIGALELLERELGDVPSGSTSGEPPLDPKHWQRALGRPLSDFLGRPGKEFRAELVRASFELCGGADELPRELPLLVELLHAGSLIVDDIEDGSAYRRGGRALHCVYGLPCALNAANWLYFWSIALLERMELPPLVELELGRAVNRALLSCHYGQALDLSVSMGDLEQGEVADVVQSTTRLKTGSLLELAASLGAIAAGASGAKLGALARYGSELGVGLQMLDDLGGILGERRCHKGHEDLLLLRPTWPWAWLAGELDPAEFGVLKQMALEVHRRELHPELLSARIAAHLRATGRERIHRHLHAALDGLRGAFGHAPALGTFLLELQRLEQSYD